MSTARWRRCGPSCPKRSRAPHSWRSHTIQLAPASYKAAFAAQGKGGGQGDDGTVQFRAAQISEGADRGAVSRGRDDDLGRSEEHTSELQSLMRISYAVFCLKKKKTRQDT